MAEALLTNTREISFGECEGLINYQPGRIHETQPLGTKVQSYC